MNFRGKAEFSDDTGLKNAVCIVILSDSSRQIEIFQDKSLLHLKIQIIQQPIVHNNPDSKDVRESSSATRSDTPGETFRLQKMSAKTAASLPANPDKIYALLARIFSSTNSQDVLDCSYELTNLLTDTVGFRGLLRYDILSEIKKAAENKKQDMRRSIALVLLGALFEKYPQKCPLSEFIFLLHDDGMLGVALDALADKGAVVRESAQYAIDALFKNLRPETMVNALLPALMAYLGRKGIKWQASVGAFELIGRMADKAKMGSGSHEEEREKDFLREIMGNRLAALIPYVAGGMHDLKVEVRHLHFAFISYSYGLL